LHLVTDQLAARDDPGDPVMRPAIESWRAPRGGRGRRPSRPCRCVGGDGVDHGRAGAGHRDGSGEKRQGACRHSKTAHAGPGREAPPRRGHGQWGRVQDVRLATSRGGRADAMSTSSGTLRGCASRSRRSRKNDPESLKSRLSQRPFTPRRQRITSQRARHRGAEARTMCNTLNATPAIARGEAPSSSRSPNGPI
jgi:hypothetical protein